MPISEKGPIGKKSKKNTRKRPIVSSDKYAAASLRGRSDAKTLEPSSGGMGIRLNTARRRFSTTM